jgi:hypothetical protein
LYLELALPIMEKFLEELRKAEPEQRERFIGLILEIMETTIKGIKVK